MSIMKVLSALLAAVAVPAPAQAQTLADTAAHLKELASRAESWVGYLNTWDHVVTAITIGLIVLGAAATFAALARKAQARWLTAAITATMTVLTGVKALVTHGDGESFGSLAVAITRTVQDARDDISTYENEAAVARQMGLDGVQGDEREYYRNAFAKHLANIEKIDDRASKLKITIMVARDASPAPSSLGSLLPGVATLLAAERGRPQAQQAADAASYVDTGVGVCSTTFGAREYARFDGRRRLALQLEPTATPERLDALIARIDASVVDASNQLTFDAGTRMATHKTRVTLKKVLTQAAFLKAPESGRSIPRYNAASAPVASGFDGRIEIGSNRPAVGNESAFTFVLQVRYAAGAVEATLVEIKSYDDSSVANSRWSFDVLAEGQRLFAVPLHRFEGSGKPTTCRPQPDENLKGSIKVTVNGPIKLSVVGYRPA
jgi:hypothetical protein